MNECHASVHRTETNYAGTQDLKSAMYVFNGAIATDKWLGDTNTGGRYGGCISKTRASTITTHTYTPASHSIHWFSTTDSHMIIAKL